MVYRHRVLTRVWHWINAVVIVVMLMSGLMIFNAHPRLYWGSYGANPDAAWLEILASPDAGVLRTAGLEINTTGVLGAWKDGEGQMQYRAFPGWATIPSDYSLATARRWHLTFAWAFGLGVLVFCAGSLINGHLWRDLMPGRGECRPGNILHDCKQHALLRFPKGEAARCYNVLQKLSYLSLVFVALPLIILSGLTMSPAMNASFPWMLDLFGGRQSARSIHFILAFALVAFVVVHLVMILLSGPLGKIRAMITGWYRLPEERDK
jgi:thiosulfate reductase cytochrome b subunit